MTNTYFATHAERIGLTREQLHTIFIECFAKRDCKFIDIREVELAEASSVDDMDYIKVSMGDEIMYINRDGEVEE